MRGNGRSGLSLSRYGGVCGLHFVKFFLEKMPEKILSLASMDTDHLHLKVDEQNLIIGQL